MNLVIDFSGRYSEKHIAIYNPWKLKGDLAADGNDDVTINKATGKISIVHHDDFYIGADPKEAEILAWEINLAVFISKNLSRVLKAPKKELRDFKPPKGFNLMINQ
jgi:hypothetical protein